MQIVLLDVALNAFDQLFDVPERAALEGVLTDETEPTLNLIQPGSVGWCEVRMESRPLREPGSHFGVLVSSVVVHHHVDVQGRRHVGFDMPREWQELLMAMTRLALRDDRPGRRIEGCKQRGGPVPEVIMGDPFGVAKAHGEDRLAALQGLDLVFSSTQSTSALSGGLRYKPTISRTFSTKNGSVESLNDRVRCGWMPKSEK